AVIDVAQAAAVAGFADPPSLEVVVERCDLRAPNQRSAHLIARVVFVTPRDTALRLLLQIPVRVVSKADRSGSVPGDLLEAIQIVISIGPIDSVRVLISPALGQPVTYRVVGIVGCRIRRE